MSKIKSTLSIVVGLISTLATLGLGSQAHAALSPVSFGVAPPVQFPPSDFSVTGIRVSGLFGNHRDLYGLDFGLLGNITQQDFVGLAVSGLFNHTQGQTTVLGLQAAGLLNYNKQKTNVYGLQFAGGLNINTAESTVNGFQIAALANVAPHTTINGVQVGLYNRAITVNGIQLGLVNVTENLRGIQIGLMNFNHKGTFAVSPILNVGF